MTAPRALAALTSQVDVVRVITGTVTAYREDGMVNVKARGQQLLACPCADSYTNRAKGDRVQVLQANRMNFVLGRIGSDPQWQAPSVTPQYSYAYSATSLAWRGADPVQLGCSGNSGDTEPLMTAWSYYNGTTNSLTSTAATATSATLLVSRSGDMHGDSGPATFEVWPHNYDALPVGSAGVPGTFQKVAGLTYVTGSVELGEVAVIPLPSDWLSGMKATTPTVRGVAVTPISADNQGNQYALLSAIAGQLRVY